MLILVYNEGGSSSWWGRLSSGGGFHLQRLQEEASCSHLGELESREIGTKNVVRI